MAKRLGYSVVGLPHYTIWHLYEPSVDDLRHMEEMEEERVALEKEKKQAEKQAEKQERADAMFENPKAEWEKDGAAIHDSMANEQQSPGSGEGSKHRDEAVRQKEDVAASGGEGKH